MPLPVAPIAAGVVATLATGATTGAVNLMQRVGKAAASGTPIRSLADVGKAARVEPIVLVEKGLEGQPYVQDIMKVALSTFTGYYLQAVSMLVNVNSVKTMHVLDSLNPERGQFSLISRQKIVGAVSDAVWSKESYANGLPSLEQFSQPIHPNLIVSVEEGNEPTPKPSVSIDQGALKQLYEADNLAVGRVVGVEFKDGNATATIPVMIRLIPAVVPAKALTHIFTATAKNSSWKERWHMWRAGQISFVRDLMFSTDIIDEHRKALINDTSNVYMTITDRRRNNSIKAIATDNPSLADASNIAIISKETAKAIGNEVGGKIENLSIRKKLFDATYLMLLIVVDEQWSRVTIYHRGLDRPTELSFAEIKNSEKGKGPDITEILKAYQLGSTPAF